MVHNVVVNIMTMSESRRGKKERKGISEKREVLWCTEKVLSEECGSQDTEQVWLIFFPVVIY